MGYFIAANCQFLGRGNFCLHPARELSKWNPLRYIAIGGKRPLCVFTRILAPPYEEEIACALQVKRRRPAPPKPQRPPMQKLAIGGWRFGQQRQDL